MTTRSSFSPVPSGSSSLSVIPRSTLMRKRERSSSPEKKELSLSPERFFLSQSTQLQSPLELPIKKRKVEIVNAPSLEKNSNPKDKLHHLTMKKKYIHQIKSGEKTVEGRIFKDRILKYQVGDRLRFYYVSNAQDDVVCRIVKLKKFSSFQEMLVKAGFKACIPEASSSEEALAIYDSIPGYREKAVFFGVVAIYLQKLP